MHQCPDAECHQREDDEEDYDDDGDDIVLFDHGDRRWVGIVLLHTVPESLGKRFNWWSDRQQRRVTVVAEPTASMAGR